MLRFSNLAALLFAITTASPAAAQVLHGRVTDAADNTPVAAAQVAALDSAGATAAWTLSGRDGSFELRLPQEGSFRLHVSRVGFRNGISPSVAVRRRERVALDVSVEAAAVQLEGIQAQARVTPPFRDRRARGFYDRLARGRGRFYTAEQIAAMDRRRTSEVITHDAGMTVRRGGLWMGGNRRGCAPIVYVDGFRWAGGPLDISLKPNEIWGIEIYRYAWEIPPELPRDNMLGNCGIIMIWTPHS